VVSSGSHALIFRPAQLVSQLVRPLHFSKEAPLEEQLSLPLLQRLDKPAVVPLQYVVRCRTYREAVRTAWELRRRKAMKHCKLAEEARLIAQHVSDYLNPDDKPKRRDLPAPRIADFEAVVGNTLVSQWLAARSSLTVLEEMQASREAA
jgi:hypothetical protein